MRGEPDILMSLLASADAAQRMAGIRSLQEALSEEQPNPPRTVIEALDHIASSDDNRHVRTEAKRLLERDEYLELYKRLKIPLPAALSPGMESPAENAEMEPIDEGDKGRKLAIASLVLGIFPVLMVLLWELGQYTRIEEAITIVILPGDSWVFVYLFIIPLTGLSSLILGIMALPKKKEEAAGIGTIVMAIAGIIFGILGLQLGIRLWLWMMSGGPT